MPPFEARQAADPHDEDHVAGPEGDLGRRDRNLYSDPKPLPHDRDRGPMRRIQARHKLSEVVHRLDQPYAPGDPDPAPLDDAIRREHRGSDTESKVQHVSSFRVKSR